ANPEEIMCFTFMPISAGEDARNSRQFRIIARYARADHRSQTAGGMEIVVNDFHLAFGQPIHSGYRVQRESRLIQLLRGEHHLVGIHRSRRMVAFSRIGSSLKWNR